jgi:hypothetical protein
MWIIAALGVAVFIASAFWSKTWITIVLPLFLFGPDFVMQFIQIGEIERLYISAGSMYVGLAIVILVLYLQNKKQNPHNA